MMCEVPHWMRVFTTLRTLLRRASSSVLCFAALSSSQRPPRFSLNPVTLLHWMRSWIGTWRHLRFPAPSSGRLPAGPSPRPERRALSRPEARPLPRTRFFRPRASPSRSPRMRHSRCAIKASWTFRGPSPRMSTTSPRMTPEHAVSHFATSCRIAAASPTGGSSGARA